MRADMDRLLERFESGWPRLPTAFRGAADMLVPELDVCDEGKQLVIETDLPGVDEKDVTVTLTSCVLTIKGEKKTEHEEKNGNL
jgi:HSP20 family protein